jgi:hypothetical protein
LQERHCRALDKLRRPRIDHDEDFPLWKGLQKPLRAEPMGDGAK